MKKQLNGIPPKMTFLENAYNEIISTIGSRPAESGGLLFGKEDDYVVQKFVFDKNAKVTRSTYTFDTEFLNPQIKRLWQDEGLACIGFIHSHPNGMGGLSYPDLHYFNSMFEFMPREKYLTPIVFTTPDGGFKLNAHILPKGASDTIKADIELLPDDYYHRAPGTMELPLLELKKPAVLSIGIMFQTLHVAESASWRLLKLGFALASAWFILQILQIITHHLLKTYPL